MHVEFTFMVYPKHSGPTVHLGQSVDVPAEVMGARPEFVIIGTRTFSVRTVVANADTGTLEVELNGHRVEDLVEQQEIIDEYEQEGWEQSDGPSYR